MTLGKLVVVKRLSLYVNYAVTFSIHKVYIPINTIHIYYIYKDYFLYRTTWTNGPCCFLHGCADCRRTRSCKKLVCILEATSFPFLCLSRFLCLTCCQRLIAGKEQSIQMPSKKGRPDGWRVHSIYLYRIIYKVFYTSQKSLSNVGCRTGIVPLCRPACCSLCLVQCLVRIQCLNHLCQ